MGGAWQEVRAFGLELEEGINVAIAIDETIHAIYAKDVPGA
jgi:hypothetical protein